MTAPFAIRRAAPTDAHTIAGHRVAMFRDMGAVAPDLEGALHETAESALAAAITEGRYVGWLATPADRPDEIVGGAGLLRRHTLPRPRAGGVSDGSQALVLNVYTTPAWRRRGVAEALMRELLDWTAAEHVAEVVLHASDDGRPLYERLGFVPTNEMRLQASARPGAAPSHRR